VTWYVYALCEPDTGAIRYVGKSSNPSVRLAGHRSKAGAKAIRGWIATLATEPGLRILSSHDDETASLIAEREQIKLLRASGVRLLNGIRGGYGGNSTVRAPRFSGLGERTIRRRKQLGLSQNSLADLAHIGRGELSRIENGHRPNTSAGVAVLLARALDVSVEWLVTGEERASSHATAAE
jgi:DNA-binding XRE family transcriptional regulator/predicted GIY-YIG superfamily endonuclease